MAQPEKGKMAHILPKRTSTVPFPEVCIKMKIIFYERDLQTIGNLSHTRPLNRNSSGYLQYYNLQRKITSFLSVFAITFFENFKIIYCPGKKSG